VSIFSGRALPDNSDINVHFARPSLPGQFGHPCPDCPAEPGRTIRRLCPDSFQERHHDAEHDAEMTRLIYTALLERARASSAASSARGAVLKAAGCQPPNTRQNDG